MAYDVKFGQSVLLHVHMRLANENDEPGRTKERGRWIRAGIPLPARVVEVPVEHQPQEAVLWSLRELESADPLLRFSAVRILAGVEWAAPEANMPEAAGQLMANLGADAIPLLTSELTSEDPTNRSIAMYGLAYLGPAGAGYVQTIAAALDRFPKEAAIPLITIGEAATSSLLGGLRQDGSVRDAILDAISEPKVLWPPAVPHAVLDTLIDMLSGSHDSVRERVADALESAGYAGPTVVAHYEARASSLTGTGRQLLTGVIARIKKE